MGWLWRMRMAAKRKFKPWTDDQVRLVLSGCTKEHRAMCVRLLERTEGSILEVLRFSRYTAPELQDYLDKNRDGKSNAYLERIVRIKKELGRE
jgi:hypothetical protein